MVKQHAEKINIREPIHSTIRQRIITRGFYVALVIIALGFGLFLYWLFQSEQVVTVNNEPFPVRTIREHPTAGGVVILSIDYCKRFDSDGTLRISFLNSHREHFLPVIREQIEKGCRVEEFPILIPNDIQPGKYVVKFRAVYNINPLKKGVVSEFVSDEFQIDP